MKKILFVIFLFYVTVLSNAQTLDFEWAQRVGTSSDEYARSVATDRFGNVFTVGVFYGTADFDPGVGIYNMTSAPLSYNIFILKMDALGNFAWAKNIGGAGGAAGAYSCIAHSISLDTLGNVYFTGNFQNTIDFDPGISVYNLTTTASSRAEVFIAKLDISGNFMWAKKLAGGLFSDDLGFGIASDLIGNVYVTGFFFSTVDFDPGLGVYNLTVDSVAGGQTDAFILKLDALGNFVWAKRLGGTLDDRGYAIDVDALGNVYTTGYFQGTADFDPGIGVFNLIPNGTYGIFISKLDSLGNFLWANSVGGNAWGNYGYSVKADRLGNVYTTGYFRGFGDFDPGVGVFNLTTIGYDDIFISKFDSVGNFVWAKNIGGTMSTCSGNAIAIDSSCNIFVTGYFDRTVDFDFGAGIFNLNAGAVSASFDTFILKIDSLGNFIWVKSLEGSYSLGNSIAVDKVGNIFTVGEFQGTVDFDPGANAFNITTLGVKDIFILKMNPGQVWPGDANHNNIVDNNDLLPIGLFYGQSGTPRTTISNSWQPFNSTDWGILQISGDDIKHIDCNGDGTIDNNDTLAVNLNFALTHTYIPANDQVRLPTSDLFLVTSSSSYLPGSIVDVEVWVGNSTAPVTDLYGLAFDINYDATLVQPASESLTYPISWLGTPGTNAITIAKVDALANIAYGAETRINHTNASGFGKIADFKFQLKSSIPANTVMYFSFSSYSANDSSGAPIYFNTQSDSIIIVSGVGVNEIEKNIQISIYPNPTNGSFNVFTSEQIKNGSIEIYNTIGELVFSQKIINQLNTIDLKNQASGLYFVKVISDGEVIGMKKVVKE